jgi:hypothetical protein
LIGRERTGREACICTRPSVSSQPAYSMYSCTCIERATVCSALIASGSFHTMSRRSFCSLYIQFASSAPATVAMLALVLAVLLSSLSLESPRRVLHLSEVTARYQQAQIVKSALRECGVGSTGSAWIPHLHPLPTHTPQTLITRSLLWPICVVCAKGDLAAFSQASPRRTHVPSRHSRRSRLSPTCGGGKGSTCRCRVMTTRASPSLLPRVFPLGLRMLRLG